MRVPYTWLMEYLDTDIAPEELAEALTMGGLEVEEVRDWTSEDGSASDLVLITKITANRGDLLSMVGVARHAAAVLGVGASLPSFSIPETDEPARAETDLELGDARITLQSVEGCPRYSALRISGVRVGPSPEWLAHRLEAAGLRPINNVVDATNYVLWELGQPLHAFDHRLIVRGHIIVRQAEDGEKLVTIDETARTLTPDDLVIADPKGAVALAGIMGGVESEMRDRTTDVLIESAHFNPTMIRRTAMRLGMSTEASYRFERHVDANLTLPALARAGELVLATAGGQIVGPAIDVCARAFEPLTIELRPERTNRVLGTDIPAAVQAELLERIGMGVQPGERLRVTVPTARWDVEREVDLIEEVAIVHGYNNIATTLPGAPAAPGLLTHRQRLVRRVREVMRAAGLCENVSFSMMGAADLDALCLAPDCDERNALRLRDPLAADEDLLRTTLLPAILDAARYNARQRVRDVALFDVG
ncbi:MAG TPA: phenylalanine--tRNA ligase subunit beta, partial [Armatimonadota bacterium]|nr:phenylalanine--tRNA ligase subunit beta [Armatimonadota bacterium]